MTGSSTVRKATPLAATLLFCALASPGVALEIVISEGWDSPTRIAVAPFGGPPLRERPGPVQTIEIADVVAFDLSRSGQFDALPNDKMLSQPTQPEEVVFRDWRIQKMDYLAIGRAWQEANGDVTILYHLYDVLAEREVLSSRWSVPPELIRDVAHRISDEIYERVTGVPGAFSSRILYVLVEDEGTPQATYRLIVADSDGQRERTLRRSTQPIMSPSWAPDSDRVAYVSFETGRSAIFVQNVESGSRTLVAAYPGINGAPVFSPDGNRLAMSLSRDGDPEIYIKDLTSGQLRRATRHRAIDTEPAWGDGGNSLIFTSDRGGQPQIYRVDLRTSLTDRLTFEGTYNARPRLLPDGRHLVYVHRRERSYHIAWQDLERGTVKVLTETALDESPSLAPNGMMMIYATRQRGRGILAAVSIDGRARYTLPSARGDVREPAWSPYIDVLR